MCDGLNIASLERRFSPVHVPPAARQNYLHYVVQHHFKLSYVFVFSLKKQAEIARAITIKDKFELLAFVN
jgi:hypothetical protein